MQNTRLNKHGEFLRQREQVDKTIWKKKQVRSTSYNIYVNNMTGFLRLVATLVVMSFKIPGKNWKK